MKCKICGQDNPLEASFCGSCGAVLADTIESVVPEAALTPSRVVPAVSVEYAGFWIRFAASIIDSIIVEAVYFLFAFLLYRAVIADLYSPFISVFWFPIPWLLPWLYYWLFIGLKGQTLGKMAVGIKVINIQGEKPGLGLAALREIVGKLVSSIVFCLGYLWIAFDEQKQGWHDKIASTYVVKVESHNMRGGYNEVS
ncbi:MAG: RDD family protein [Dehalococcoidales bacterium]|nr:MAG: RDD family protein [Dehalococcoidales bacterium]